MPPKRDAQAATAGGRQPTTGHLERACHFKKRLEMGSKAGAESKQGHRQGVFKTHAQQFRACSSISRAAVSIQQDLVPSVELPRPMASGFCMAYLRDDSGKSAETAESVEFTEPFESIDFVRLLVECSL
ncbi:hypothetical protein RRG08_046856 [Elysia crispata]|uniref:Uncharacterized protein n=1 Tax=Elysia crispata TaxID=231223 RepID=A0AAE0ZNV5_9GAST|nr:hypothetical protein RRG08_046856 [Elysia crispata]